MQPAPHSRGAESISRTRIHLLHLFPGFEIGGIQTRTSAIINGLDDRFHHTIIALNGDYTCAARLSPDASVDLRRQFTPAVGLRRSIADARRTLREIRPDLLITYNWPTLDWALTNGVFSHCPHIHQEDGFNLDEADRQLARRIVYRRLSLLRNDLLIVPSHTLYQIARDVWRRPAGRVCRIANGIPWQKFAAARGHGRPATTVLGTIAPLRPEKNIVALLRALAALRRNHDVELLIIGDGPERRRLETLASELQLTDVCRFQGQRDDVVGAFAPLEIFMMPSRTEQMPISLLQAMASAKAVVAYDVGDIKRIVADENTPFIVPRDDERALVRCTEQLIADADRRHQLGIANLARVKSDYCAATMIERYQDIYLRIATGQR